MSNPKCIVTGCALVVDDGEHAHSHYWGDLHQVGDAYIFNSNVTNEGGDANTRALLIKEAPHNERPIVVIPYGVNYFERRGVFIFDGLACNLNDAAKERIMWRPRMSS